MLLRTAREVTKGRIITVFGCGGDRDGSKRAPMGEAAGSLSDVVILTSDNPRTEDPNQILADTEVGYRKPGSLTKRSPTAAKRSIRRLPRREQMICFDRGQRSRGLSDNRSRSFSF